MDEWRENYNGDKVGYGTDPYRPLSYYDYPEAYAVWGSGYIRFFNITRDFSFLVRAKRSAD